MNVKFAFSNAINDLKKHKLMSAAITASLFLALLFVVLVVAFVLNTYQYMFSSLPKSPERIVVLTVDSPNSPVLDSNEIKEKYDTIAFFYVDAGFNTVVDSGDMYSPAKIVVTESDSTKSSKLNIVRGSNITKENFDNVSGNCIISSNIDLDLGGNIQTININNREFNVLGVLHDKNIRDRIFISKNDYLDLGENINTYVFLLKEGYDYSNEGIKIINSINQEYFNGLKIHHGPVGDLFDEDYRLIYPVLIAGVVVELFVLIYCVLNILTVLLNKHENERKSIYIRMLLGAKKRDLFMQKFIEIGILSVIAVSFDVLTIVVLKEVIQSYIGFYLSIHWLLILSGIATGFLTAMFISVFLLRKSIILFQKGK